jgi:hypothetical protein
MAQKHWEKDWPTSAVPGIESESTSTLIEGFPPLWTSKLATHQVFKGNIRGWLEVDKVRGRRGWEKLRKKLKRCESK